jgi:hypothetical protein
MARKYKPISLYEVIKSSRPKDSADKGLRRLHLFRPSEKRVKRPAKKAEEPLEWPGKPKILQFSANRVEISLPYEFAIAVVLGVVLIAMLAFRVGQWQGQGQQGDEKAGIGTKRTKSRPLPVVDTAGITQFSDSKLQRQSSLIEKVKMVEPVTDHRIVIQQCQVYADLVPVQKHFATYGIGTEIEKRGEWYFLVTIDRFSNPEKQGTAGYEMKQKIIEAGAKYKSPRGYATFAPGLFSDAYGEKIQ